MSNTRIIENMKDVLNMYKNKNYSATEVESTLENYLEALDRIQQKEIDQLRQLTYKLVTSDFTMGEEEFTDEPKVEEVLLELEQFIENLPTD